MFVRKLRAAFYYVGLLLLISLLAKTTKLKYTKPLGQLIILYDKREPTTTYSHETQTDSMTFHAITLI